MANILEVQCMSTERLSKIGPTREEGREDQKIVEITEERNLQVMYVLAQKFNVILKRNE